jgi:hypothetical protein
MTRSLGLGATIGATEGAGGEEVPGVVNGGRKTALTGRCKVIGCSVTLTHGRWTHDSMRELVLCMATRIYK